MAYSNEGIALSSDFYQKAVAQAKLSFYPTDTEMARRIGGLFSLPEGVSANVLEPSCGEGDALIAFRGNVSGGERLDAYGVELDHTRADAAKRKNFFKAVIEEDFLKGVKISNSCFSIIFANPPYGEGDDHGDRLESMFLRSITRYACAGAYIVWIVPDACLKNAVHQKLVDAAFDICACYRFDDREYAKYHQYALILRKKKVRSLADADRIGEFLKTYPESPYLPQTPTREFEIKPSEPPRLFASKEFNPELYKEDVRRYFDGRDVLITPEYKQTSLYSQPPHQLKDESLYMCMACGIATGEIGSERDGNLHLLKGRIEKCEMEQVVGAGETDEGIKVKVRENNQVRLTVVTEQTITPEGVIPAQIITLR